MTRGIATLALACAALGMLLSPVQAQERDEVLHSVSEGATDLPNDNTTPGRVAVGGSATGAIGIPKDQDRFAVDLEAGRTYRFDLTGRPGGGGTLRDTYFRAIYNSEGRYQSGSYNDDFDGGRDSRVTFTAPGSGTYYARVSGDRNETGTYTLSVTDVTPEQGAGPPAKPRGLSATATHGRVVLTWDDPQDDSITGYVILRRIPGVDPEGQFSELVSDTGTAAATYTDDTVAAETRYTYRIKAINEHGVSERSRWVHIDTPAAPVPAKPKGLSATATPRPGGPHLGRSGQRLHHRLRDPAARPRERYRGRLQRTGGGHRHGGADLHRQHGGGQPHLHLPHQGHQRVWGERALPLGPHRHPGRAGGDLRRGRRAGREDEQGGEDDPVGAPGHATPSGPGGTDKLVELRDVPPARQGFNASNGNEQVTLTWDAPDADADITRHEYRFKTTGDYPSEWTEIDDSAPGEAHEDWSW